MNVVKRLIYAKVDWLGLINSISYGQFVMLYTTIFFFGRILLQFNPIRFDFLHQILLTIISFMVIYSLKYAYTMVEKLRDASSRIIYATNGNDCPEKTIQMITEQMINAQHSVWWPVVMLLPVIEFVKKNLYLGFIEKNFAGYYALIFAASTYYIALLGYAQIIIALFQFYKISHNDGKCIPLEFPIDAVIVPEWLSLWNQLFEKIIKVFFCVGTLFTLEYILLMPKDVVTIDNGKYIFHVNDPRAFLMSWITIVVFIIIAFPIISVVIKRMQKLLIKNLGKKINHEYMLRFSENLSEKSALDIWAYKQLLEASGKYSNYIRTGKSIIPLASTVISLVLNVIKLYESVLLPLLNI